MDNLKKGLGKYAADLALIAGGVLAIVGAMLSILGGDKS